MRQHVHLRRLDKHLTHQTAMKDVHLLAYIYVTALGRITADLTKAEKADLRRRIRLNATPVCAGISPRIHGLLFRQGGARQRGKVIVAGPAPDTSVAFMPLLEPAEPAAPMTQTEPANSEDEPRR